MPPAGSSRLGPVPADQWLRDAAFGDAPGADVWRVAGASETPERRWLAAVVLGGQGRYAAAATVLTGLLAGPDRVTASLAASALASHRRQLGAHAAARPLDALALRLASRLIGAATPDPDGVDRAGATVDALLGLAADAVGLGRPGQARRLLAAAGRAATGLAAAGSGAGPVASWRAKVRLGWLAAEVELAAGNPGAAVRPARESLAESRRHGAVRHEAKSMLVLAAALATAGDREAALALLPHVTALAQRHGLVPLAWPAGLLLAELTAGEHGFAAAGHRERTRHALRIVFSRADAPLRAAVRGSLWVPSDMLRTGDSAERSSVGEIHGKYVIGTCQGLTPRDR